MYTCAFDCMLQSAMQIFCITAPLIIIMEAMQHMHQKHCEALHLLKALQGLKASAMLRLKEPACAG